MTLSAWRFRDRPSNSGLEPFTQRKPLEIGGRNPIQDISLR